MKVSVLFTVSTSGALCVRRLKPRCYCRWVLMSAGGEVLAGERQVWVQRLEILAAS